MLRSPSHVSQNSSSFLSIKGEFQHFDQSASRPELMEIVEECPEAVESPSNLQEVELSDILQAPSFLASQTKSKPGAKDRSSTVHSSTKASSGLQVS